MYNLIEIALNEASSLLQEQIPCTKKVTLTRSLVHIDLIDLFALMQNESIPKDAIFSVVDGDCCLIWEDKVRMTTTDQTEYKKRRFPHIAYQFVYKLLIVNGYYRHGYNTSLLRQFKSFCIYSAYMDKDFDTLSEYYSLSFSLICS